MAFTIPAGNKIAGAPNFPADIDNAYTALSAVAGINVLNTAYAGGAKGDGTTDDTAAIQAAINAANGIQPVILPDTGNPYVVSSPLVPAGGRIWLRGQKGAVQSGSGASANVGTVIKVSASFTNPSGLPITAVVAVINGDGSTNTSLNLALDIRDLWIDCQSSPASVDAIASWGATHGMHIQHVGVSKATGYGIAFYKNSNFVSSNFAQGPYLHTVILQAGNASAPGAFITTATDTTAFNVHVQNGGGDGFTIQSGNNRWHGCRADLQTGHGFVVDAAGPGGGFFDANTFIGPGTQGNYKNGFHITNTSGSGQASRSPVFIVGATLDGDGQNAGAGGGGYAGLHVEGRNTVFADNLNVLNATVWAAGGSPDYGVSTASIGSGPGVPDVVKVTSGMLNTQVGLVNDTAPAIITDIGPCVYGYAGATYVGQGSTPLARLYPDSSSPEPSDTAYQAWTYDPASITGGTALGTAGTGYGTAFFVRRTKTVTKFVCYVTTGGGTLTSGQCFGAIYDAAGNLLGKTADQATNWASVGVNGAAAAPVTLTAVGSLTLKPGKYWAVAHFNGTTGPQLARATSTAGIAALNAGSSGSGLRAGALYTGATTAPPSTFTPGSIVTSSIPGPYFFGVQ